MVSGEVQNRVKFEYLLDLTNRDREASRVLRTKPHLPNRGYPPVPGTNSPDG